MPSSAEILEENLALAMQAVEHVLHVICNNPKVAYEMGHCTQSYELLCQAVAASTGQSVEEVQEIWEPARQPGQPSRHEEASLSSLSEAQVFLCQVLHLPPFLATEVLAFADREGLDTWFYRNPDVALRSCACDQANDLYRLWWTTQAAAA